MKSPQDVAAIGRFQVVEVLGKGPSGVVYLARDEHGSLVSIKALPSSLASDPVSLGRLRSEARALEQLRHPHVVSLLEVDTDPVLGMFLVMDYAPGRPLRAVLDEQVFLDPEIAGIVAQQICEALDAAHQEGIIHRDITPDSVIIGEDYTVTVTDFGIAKLTESTGLTLPGVIPGHPEYMSPEQASGLAQLDQCSDIYACGVVLYEMLTGSVPFRAPSSLRTMQMQMFEEPEPPRTRRPHIPQKLEAIVLRALQKEPGDRFPTAGAMAKELEIWLRYVEANPLPKPPRDALPVAETPPPKEPPLPPAAAAFEPKAGDPLVVGARSLAFAASPFQESAGWAHSARGDHSTVYRLTSPGGARDQALKVFSREDLRVKELAGLAGCLWAAAGLQGLQALDRSVLDPDDAGTADLLRANPSLRYAVLMPWIEGPQWAGVVYHKYQLSQEECTTFGKALLELLSALEVMNLAHCNLSATNLLLPLLGAEARAGSAPVELVDLEQMYAPGLTRPLHRPPSAPGYVRRGADGAAPWGPAADRRAGGLLVAEILTWWHPSVADGAWGETLFNPREIGTDCPRYQAVLEALERDWGRHAALTFHGCWTSASDSECPDFQEWWEALRPPTRGAVAPPPPPPPPLTAPEPAPSVEEETEAVVLPPPVAPAPPPVPVEEAPDRVEETPAPEEEAPAVEPVAPPPRKPPTIRKAPVAETLRTPKKGPVLRSAPVVRETPAVPRTPAAHEVPVFDDEAEDQAAPAAARPEARPTPAVEEWPDEPVAVEEPPAVVEEPPPAVETPVAAAKAPPAEDEWPVPRRPSPEERPSSTGPGAGRGPAAGSSPSSAAAIHVRVSRPEPDSSVPGPEVDVEGRLEYRTPITFFTVRSNGRQVRLTAEEFSEITRTGRFLVRVPLEAGENSIEIVARGKGGANGKTTFTVRMIAGAAEPVAPADSRGAAPSEVEALREKGDAGALALLFLGLVPGVGVLAALILWVLWMRDSGSRRPLLLICAATASALAALGVAGILFFWDELLAVLPFLPQSP